MGRGLNKAERLKQMEWDYTQRAYSDTEMAERLGVDRATVFRDRRELTAEHPFTTIAPGRYRIDRKGYISHIDVTLHEALALYLAARRSSRQTRLAQPHAASALEKLAVALKQPMTERLVRAAQSIMEQSTQPERVKVLEVVTQAWVEQRKLEITYRALNVPRSRQHLIHPYLIEPSIWSDGVYLIGHSETHGGLATFKIERIETAEKTIQSFEIPETFDEQELLRHAWGIWYREGELITVRLRFRPGAAAQRLAESIWHPNQQPLQPLEDGGCIWQAQVAEWQEMLPWVRGWGADVEVLEPEGMRNVIMGEAKAMAESYGWFVYSHPSGQPGSTLSDFFGG